MWVIRDARAASNLPFDFPADRQSTDGLAALRDRANRSIQAPARALRPGRPRPGRQPHRCSGMALCPACGRRTTSVAPCSLACRMRLQGPLSRARTSGCDVRGPLSRKHRTAAGRAPRSLRPMRLAHPCSILTAPPVAGGGWIRADPSGAVRPGTSHLAPTAHRPAQDTLPRRMSRSHPGSRFHRPPHASTDLHRLRGRRAGAPRSIAAMNRNWNGNRPPPTSRHMSCAG